MAGLPGDYAPPRGRLLLARDYRGDVPPKRAEAVAAALAGLRANEARYFKNKYDHTFTTTSATAAKKTIAWVHHILKTERDLVIASPPLPDA